MILILNLRTDKILSLKLGHTNDGESNGHAEASPTTRAKKRRK